MVKFTEKYLGELLLRKLKQLEHHETVISIVKSNSQGNIYLIGGTVCRTLASAIYDGTPKKSIQKDKDFDFVVDKLNERLIIPVGWEVLYHKFGNPTLKKDHLEIDIFPLSDQEYIKTNNKKPNITNFLKGVPFTIQAIAFDINNEKLIGKVGIMALKERKIKVNNLASAKEVAKRKGASINEIMLQNAKSMNFEIGHLF